MPVALGPKLHAKGMQALHSKRLRYEISANSRWSLQSSMNDQCHRIAQMLEQNLQNQQTDNGGGENCNNWHYWSSTLARRALLQCQGRWTSTGAVSTTISAMNMSSLKEEDEPAELREDIAAMFSSSSVRISLSLQFPLQKAFSPLQRTFRKLFSAPGYFYDRETWQKILLSVYPIQESSSTRKHTEFRCKMHQPNTDQSQSLVHQYHKFTTKDYWDCTSCPAYR